MKKGFTLVETLVVVSALAIIVATLSGVLLSVLTSKSKNEAVDKITQNGNFVLNEIKKNIINADSRGENGGNFSCTVGSYGNSITFTSVKDGDKTTISCFNDPTDGYKIASISGKSVGTTIFLFQRNDDLKINNCDNFVTCSTLPSLQLSNVKFNFALNAGVFGLSSGTSKPFSIDVTLRN